ncbi:BcII family subclass B1 metallo-beta-lactamase [Nemorincola caseinilytica]|uniref:beta-lactamase n=1 Tax=Nemorincola caseinilytica TaxID=2054315 RepID=A0ABP8N2S8_9BACT
MNRWGLILLFSVAMLLQACHVFRKTALYRSPTLEVDRLTKNTFIHRTFLYDNKWGKVACNGLIYINNKEALVIDAATNDTVAAELLAWIRHYKYVRFEGVVVTHFHDDRLGGLREFHRQGVASYANKLTQAYATRDTVHRPAIPLVGFEQEKVLDVGGEKVICRYFGPGHTRDNIVCYISREKVLFGGCLIKAVGTGRGNLNDADTTAWHSTVQAIKDAYPDVKHVVPGHDDAGDEELLEHTMGLFPARR